MSYVEYYPGFRGRSVDSERRKSLDVLVHLENLSVAIVITRLQIFIIFVFRILGKARKIFLLFWEWGCMVLSGTLALQIAQR